jgi:hypothetical protein
MPSQNGVVKENDAGVTNFLFPRKGGTVAQRATQGPSAASSSAAVRKNQEDRAEGPFVSSRSDKTLPPFREKR